MFMVFLFITPENLIFPDLRLYREVLGKKGRRTGWVFIFVKYQLNQDIELDLDEGSI